MPLRVHACVRVCVSAWPCEWVGSRWAAWSAICRLEILPLFGTAAFLTVKWDYCGAGITAQVREGEKICCMSRNGVLKRSRAFACYFFSYSKDSVKYTRVYLHNFWILLNSVRSENTQKCREWFTRYRIAVCESNFGHCEPTAKRRAKKCESKKSSAKRCNRCIRSSLCNRNRNRQHDQPQPKTGAATAQSGAGPELVL